jgi:uncharacterized protein (DUF1697 family)
MTLCVALLRGINVGRAKRVAMADLRGLVEGLGFTRVRTLLNSGNVVFTAASPDVVGHARAIRAALVLACGFDVPVVVVTAAELAAVVREDPLGGIADDPARYLVAFVPDTGSLDALRRLLDEPWSPEAVALGRRAAYLWCAHGVADSRLAQACLYLGGDGITTRNWTTVLKLLEAAGQ